MTAVFILRGEEAGVYFYKYLGYGGGFRVETPGITLTIGTINFNEEQNEIPLNKEAFEGWTNNWDGQGGTGATIGAGYMASYTDGHVNPTAFLWGTPTYEGRFYKVGAEATIPGGAGWTATHSWYWRKGGDIWGAPPYERKAEKVGSVSTNSAEWEWEIVKENENKSKTE